MEYSEVKELIEIFEKTDLNDMEVTLGNDSLRLNRSPVPLPPSVPPVKVAENKEPQVQKDLVSTIEKPEEDRNAESGRDSEETEGQVITAPIVGTFYQSSAPDAPPFVKVGDKIAAGDVVCIIEAMKFMNEVNSEIAGTVAEILVQDGEFVEYGQELFRIK